MMSVHHHPDAEIMIIKGVVPHETGDDSSTFEAAVSPKLIKVSIAGKRKTHMIVLKASDNLKSRRGFRRFCLQHII